jgi:hypothetical protein
MKEKLTPPFEELGDRSGININRTTTAKSWREHIKNLSEDSLMLTLSKRHLIYISKMR